MMLFYIVNLRFADVVLEKILARLLVHGYMYILCMKRTREEPFVFSGGLGGRKRGGKNFLIDPVGFIGGVGNWGRRGRK